MRVRDLQIALIHAHPDLDVAVDEGFGTVVTPTHSVESVELTTMWSVDDRNWYHKDDDALQDERPGDVMWRTFLLVRT